VYTCNTCQKSVETRYHCTVCDDFDLCVACYQKDGHPHKMERLGFDLDGGGGDAAAANNPQVRMLWPLLRRVLRISDVYPGSRIQIFSIKEFQVFQPRKMVSKL
jgi:hypothetical protein